MERCELSHIARTPIDLEAARAQHAAYEQCLRDLGCRVHRLPSDDTMPDAVFLEDTAVVVDEFAVLTRPGAASRRGEVAAVAEALEPFRATAEIREPGTLDGGDVLRLGHTIYVGLSARSNAEGITQLGRHLAPHGYRVEGVVTHDCLHLKTAVTEAAPGLLVLNPAWVDGGMFRGIGWWRWIRGSRSRATSSGSGMPPSVPRPTPARARGWRRLGWPPGRWMSPSSPRRKEGSRAAASS